MTWKNRAKETQSVYQCLAVVFAIHLAIGLYLIAGMDAAENTAKSKAQMMEVMVARDKELARELVAMDSVSDTATKRAVKEYGR